MTGTLVVSRRSLLTLLAEWPCWGCAAVLVGWSLLVSMACALIWVPWLVLMGWMRHATGFLGRNCFRSVSRPFRLSTGRGVYTGSCRRVGGTADGLVEGAVSICDLACSLQKNIVVRIARDVWSCQGQEMLTYLRQAISEQAKGRATSSSGRKLDEKLRDCATRDSAKLTSSDGKSLACVGTSVANACSTGRLFIDFAQDKGRLGRQLMVQLTPTVVIPPSSFRKGRSPGQRRTSSCQCSQCRSLVRLKNSRRWMEEAGL